MAYLPVLMQLQSVKLLSGMDWEPMPLHDLKKEQIFQEICNLSPKIYGHKKKRLQKLQISRIAINYMFLIIKYSFYKGNI